MQLGVILTGTGAPGAAGAGVLEALAARGIEPYAVCGMGAGAWPAALYAAGCDGARMREAASQVRRMEKRLTRPDASCRALLRGKRGAMLSGAAAQRLLVAQTGARILALCPRRAIFPVRTPRMGLVFSTRPFATQGGTIMTMQASVSFAARAAMALPPFLAPAEWMGAPLLPETDIALSAGQLLAMGAQRVLVVRPQLSPRREPDALTLTAMGAKTEPDALPQGVAVLRVTMPDAVGALTLRSVEACVDAGKKTAERELDRIFERLGMAFCRVLPFRREI